MSNKPGFFRQLKDTQNYSTKFLIVLFSPNSGVTPTKKNADIWLSAFFGIDYQHDYKRLIVVCNEKNKHTQCVILSLKATLVTAIINAITAL